MSGVQVLVLVVFAQIFECQCYVPSTFYHVPLLFGFLPRPNIPQPPSAASGNQPPTKPAPPNPAPEPVPSVPVAAPRYPVQAPRSPHQAPRYPARAPHYPVQAPRYPAQIPYFPAQAPRYPAQAPRYPAQAPRYPAQAPRYPAQAPHYPAHYPHHPAQAPLYPAQAPLYPAQAPRYPPQSSRYPAQVPTSDPVQAPRAPVQVPSVPDTPGSASSFPKIRILYDTAIPYSGPEETITDGPSTFIESRSVYQPAPDFVEPSRDWVFHHSDKNIDTQLEPLASKGIGSSSKVPYSPLLAAAQRRFDIGSTTMQMSPLQDLQSAAAMGQDIGGGPVSGILPKASRAPSSLRSSPFTEVNSVVGQLPHFQLQQLPPLANNPTSVTNPQSPTTQGDTAQTTSAIIQKLLYLLLNNPPPGATPVHYGTSVSSGRSDPNWRNNRNLAIQRAHMLVRSIPTIRMNPIFDPKILMPENQWTGIADTMLEPSVPRRLQRGRYLAHLARQRVIRRRLLGRGMGITARGRTLTKRPTPSKLIVFFRRLDIVGKVDAARNLDCDPMAEVLGLELNPYLPMKCEHDNICPAGKTCRNTATVGFCCPTLVKGSQINTKGLVERYNALSNLFL